MESPIKSLLEKYWAGDTSLSEEQQIKEHFAENPSLTGDGKYFRAIDNMKSTEKVKFIHPGKSKMKAKWSVAAAITIGLMTALVVLQDAKEQRQFVVEDPQEAYEITRKALLMVSSGLKDGKKYSTQITKINKAEEILIEN